MCHSRNEKYSGFNGKIYFLQGFIMSKDRKEILETITTINRNGYLELFVTGTDNKLWYKSHKNGASVKEWSDWHNLGGGIASSSTVIHRNGYLELFATGTDNKLWYKSHKDGASAKEWSDWHDLGGGIASSSTVIHRNGYLELFATGKDNKLWYKSHKDGASAKEWSDWHDLGGGIASSSTVTHRNGYLELFVTGIDNKLWYKSHKDGASTKEWSDWHDLGDGIASSSTVIHRNGYLELFVTGTDNNLWYKFHKDGASAKEWSSWHDLGGGIASSSTVIHRNGYLELFVTGTDNNLWYKFHKDGASAKEWSGWHDLGGGIASSSAVIHRNGYLEIFVTGTDNKLWYKSHKDGASAKEWSSWYDLGNSISSTEVGEPKEQNSDFTIIETAKRGDFPVVEKTLENSQVDMMNNDEHSPLQPAAENRIKNEIKIHPSNKDLRNDLKGFKEDLDKFRGAANPNFEFNYNRALLPEPEVYKAIHLAAWYGDKLFLELLLSQSEVKFEEKTSLGENLLHCAAVNNQIEVIKYLIDERKIDVNALNDESESPLHYAAKYGHLDLAKLLLHKGCSLTLKDKAENNPAEIAQKNGYKELSLWLNKQEMLSSCERGEVENVKRLLPLLGEHAKSLVDEEKNNIFFIGLLNKHDSIIQFLLYDNNVLSVDSLLKAKNNKNEGLLHIAAKVYEVNFLGSFLSKFPQLDLNEKNNDGCTPLHLAIIHKLDNNIKSLLRHEAEIKNTSIFKFGDEAFSLNTVELIVAKGNVFALEQINAHNAYKLQINDILLWWAVKFNQLPVLKQP